MSKIGLVDPEIWAKKWSKSVKLGRLRGFLRKSLTDTETMMMTNIIGNFVADNIFLGM